MKLLITSVLGVVVFLGADCATAGDYRCDEEAATCLNGMARHLKKKGWVGIEIDHEESRGAMVVRRVVPDSPAENSGFQIGDVLVSFNNISYSGDDQVELKKAYARAAPGDEVTYVVARDGDQVELKIELARVPANVVASWIGQHMLEHHVEEPVGGAE